MHNYQTIYVKNLKFSIENLETKLKNQLPGIYKVVWFTSKNSWEMKLKWNGQEFVDLVDSYY